MRTRNSKILDAIRAVAVDLERHPGRWLRVFDFEGDRTAAGSATAPRKAFPDLEIKGCAVDGGGSAIFARYVEEG